MPKIILESRFTSDTGLGQLKIREMTEDAKSIEPRITALVAQVTGHSKKGF